MNQRSLPKKSLTNLITQLLVSGVGIMMFGIILQSSYSSIKSIDREGQRSIEQTSRLLQSVLNYKLTSLYSHQNANATGSVLSNFLLGPLSKHNLDDYFFEIDHNDPMNAPDLRFIATGEKLAWSDGSGLFYGIEEQQLQQLLYNKTNSYQWYLQRITTLVGPSYLLLRRTPVIAPDSGKVIGHLYIAIVLSNNISLAEELSHSCGADAIFIVAGKQIITSNISSQHEIYQHFHSQLQSGASLGGHQYLTNQLPVMIDGYTADINVITVQNNHNLIAFMQSFLYEFIFSLMVMVSIALIARHMITTRMARSLKQLMSYLHSATDLNKIAPFTGSDITEFDQIGNSFEATLQQLVEKEQSLKDLFDFALSPIMVWDKNLAIERLNPAAAQYLDYQPNMDKPSHNYFTFKAKIDSDLRRAWRGEVIRGVQIDVCNHIFCWNLAPLVLDGKVRSVIAQGLDITSLVEAEHQSRQAQLAAEASARAKSDFLARMSHEIRTPLNGILGISQLMSDINVDPKLQQQLDILYHSSEHLLSVVNDILDFSKIEQGKLELEHTEFSISELLNPIVDMYRSECENKGIKLTLLNQVPDELRLCSDKSRMVQIIINLINNAVKFTNHGLIEVRCEILNEQAQHARLLFEVQDTGIGIRSERLEQLFEPFTQAETSTTREYGGSGLGLSIVKNLVDLLNGEIHVKSQPQVGSTFSVQLNLDRSYTLLPTPTKVPPSEEISFDPPLQVLLVEDNRPNALIAKLFCQKHNLQVDWVDNGQTAIERLKSRHYDLILMDNHMPQLSGIEATRIIKQELNIETPIYAFTADAYAKTHNEFLEAGAAHIIVKPIVKKRFVQALKHYRENFWVPKKPTLVS